MRNSFTEGRLHQKRRCQRPGCDATPEQIAEYNTWRKLRTYWRNLPAYVTGVAYD